MNDYTIKNCATDNLDTFRANVRKCIDVLEQHRDNEYAQIVLQMPETMEHNIWNFFIYPGEQPGIYTTSWQDYGDGEDIEDYDFISCKDFEAVIEEVTGITPDVEPENIYLTGNAWYEIELMEVTW